MVDLLENFRGVLDPESAEARLILDLDPSRLPRHVAVIMDGNGRWAKQRGLQRVEGHSAGIKSVRATVETCVRLELQVLTLYAFSAENWKRPISEVNTLMELLKEYLREELPEIQENDIRFLTIGRVDDLPSSVQRALKHVETETQSNRGMQMVLALNYGGRTELVDAFNSLVKKGSQHRIREQDIEANLYTAGLPEPDLLIRTSGEMRVSNFLLWQIAYSEIYVTDVLWPDFRSVHLFEAILDFQKRERRYGGILAAQFQSSR